MAEINKMTTNLETERMTYKLLLASDEQDGKIVDLDLFVLAKVKQNGSVRHEPQRPSEEISIEELLARRGSGSIDEQTLEKRVDQAFNGYNMSFTSAL